MFVFGVSGRLGFGGTGLIGGLEVGVELVDQAVNTAAFGVVALRDLKGLAVEEWMVT